MDTFRKRLLFKWRGLPEKNRETKSLQCGVATQAIFESCAISSTKSRQGGVDTPANFESGAILSYVKTLRSIMLQIVIFTYMDDFVTEFHE
jgi:hypothetical protein